MQGGDLPSYKLGGTRLIKVTDLEQLIEGKSSLLKDGRIKAWKF